MIHFFAGYQLDTEKCELRSSDALIPVEPQVLALLRLLIENRERLVGKDEIIERIWKGRIVSDAAVASRIKSARRAIGDDGGAQRMIRTLHRLGFRFVGEVKTINPAKPAFAQATCETEIDPPGGGEVARPSIAVLPFALLGVAGSHGEISDSLPHDLIVEMSRLRWLFVIARGSSFQFRGADAKFDRVKVVLGARYCLSGVIEIDNALMIVRVELCDTDDGGIVWSEMFRADIAAVHEIRAEIVHSVVNALELRIPLNEARRARLRSPENLDAWSAYHLGLNQMYRFCGDGNTRAQALFERAIAMEPAFARAHAGLSLHAFCSRILKTRS